MLAEFANQGHGLRRFTTGVHKKENKILQSPARQETIPEEFSKKSTRGRSTANSNQGYKMSTFAKKQEATAISRD